MDSIETAKFCFSIELPLVSHRDKEHEVYKGKI
jgi:hypothetical protein